MNIVSLFKVPQPGIAYLDIVAYLNFKTPIAYTEPLFKQMIQVKHSDFYTCHLLNLYHKLYRNRLH